MSDFLGTSLVVGDYRYTRRDESWTMTHKDYDYRTPVPWPHDIAMIEAIATLTAENARLREDAARLDWIGRQMDGVHIEAGLAGGEYQMRRFATVYTFTQEFRADNVRAALDTARAQGRP